MAARNLAAVCGTYCGSCRFFRARCEGCKAVGGKPFWTVEYHRESCGLYDCAVNKKNLEHCGECAELPCKLFIESSDPSLTPEQARSSREARIIQLKIRNAIGTGTRLKQNRSIGK